MAVLMDSGERREFESGAVRDIREGKGRCDLLPILVLRDFYDGLGDTSSAFIIGSIHDFVLCGSESILLRVLREFVNQHPTWKDCETMFLEMAIHFEDGAKKYGERNWEKGIPVHCYIDSGLRHYLKWKRGDLDEPHDRAFCWNMACAYWTCHMSPGLNDYFTGDELG